MLKPLALLTPLTDFVNVTEEVTVGRSNRQTKEQSYTSSALNYITPQPSLWCVSVYLTLLPFLLRPFLYSLLPLFSPAFTATTAFVSLPPCLTSLPQVTTSAGCFPLEYISWDFRPYLQGGGVIKELDLEVVVVGWEHKYVSGNTSEYGGADESEGMVLSLNTHKKKKTF